MTELTTKRPAEFLVPKHASVRVFLVKGAEVRRRVDPEFKEGGVYEDEIWLDAELRPSELRVKLAELELPPLELGEEKQATLEPPQEDPRALPETELTSRKAWLMVNRLDGLQPPSRFLWGSKDLAERMETAALDRGERVEHVDEVRVPGDPVTDTPSVAVFKTSAPKPAPAPVTLGDLIEKAAGPILGPAATPVAPSVMVGMKGVDPGPPILSQEPLSRLRRLTREPVIQASDPRQELSTLFSPEALTSTVKRIQATSKRITGGGKPDNPNGFDPRRQNLTHTADGVGGGTAGGAFPDHEWMLGPTGKN